jgi:imidazolonepropionase-like amidohydrolase
MNCNPKWKMILGLAGAGLLTGSALNAESLWLTGATVHPVAGPVITNGAVLVQAGKITGVYDLSQPPRWSFPADRKEINLTGRHLYPGLIALDTELGLREVDSVRGTVDVMETGVGFNPEVETWLAVNPDSEQLPVARANGIAYFEPAPRGALVAGQSGLLAIHGWTTEEMVLRRAVGLHIYWPDQQLTVAPRDRGATRPGGGSARTLEEQAKERREAVKALDDFFLEAGAYAQAKAAATSGRPAPPVPAYEAMLPYVRGERPLIIHANEVRQIRSAVKWAEAGKRKIVLAGARDAWRVADLLASNNIPVIYGSMFTLPARDTDGYDTHFRAPGILHRAGVKVAFTVSLDPHSLLRNLPYDAAQAVAFGLPASEALKGLTLYPAQIAGVADQLGSIEPGKVATLVVTDGDLLDVRSNVQRMWINGQEISLASRHTRLYERYRARPAGS